MTDDKNWRGGIVPLSHAEAQQMGREMFNRWTARASCDCPVPFMQDDAAWADLARAAFEGLRDARACGMGDHSFVDHPHAEPDERLPRVCELCGAMEPRFYPGITTLADYERRRTFEARLRQAYAAHQPNDVTGVFKEWAVQLLASQLDEQGSHIAAEIVRQGGNENAYLKTRTALASIVRGLRAAVAA